MQVWHYKQFQEAIKKELWSHSKASDEEKAYKTATLKQPKKPKRDTFAEMEEKQQDIPLRRDSRRFVMVEENEADDDGYQPISLSGKAERDEKPPTEEYEMKSRPPAYSASEDEPLMPGTDSKKSKAKKEKKPKKGSASKDDEEDGSVEGETTPLYANPVYKSRKERDDDKIQLQDESKADSWV